MCHAGMQQQAMQLNFVQQLAEKEKLQGEESVTSTDATLVTG